VTSLVAARTGKIWKNRLRVFEIRQNLLQNGVFNFAFRLSQSSGIMLEIKQVKNPPFEKGLDSERLRTM